MVYSRNIRVLLVEDDSRETQNIQKLFNEIENSPSKLVREKFELFCADKFPAAIAHLSSGETDAWT